MGGKRGTDDQTGVYGDEIPAGLSVANLPGFTLGGDFGVTVGGGGCGAGGVPVGFCEGGVVVVEDICAVAVHCCDWGMLLA